MEMAGQVECIALNEGTLLIASADGRSWLTSIGTSTTVALPRSEVARKRASIAAAAIEGAIYAGLTNPGDMNSGITDQQSAAHGVRRSSQRTSPSREPASARHTLLRYVKWLAGNAVFAAQTPGLFREAACRFDRDGRADLARFASQKATEEDGHAALALADLAALGWPEGVVDALRPPSADAFAQRFAELVRSDSPVALFGFSYCLERMALGRDAGFVRTVASALPANVRAQRFLDVHSALGNDHAHVEEQLALFEAMTSADLCAVMGAAFDTARLLAAQQEIDRELNIDELAQELEHAETKVDSAPLSIREQSNPNTIRSSNIL